MLDTGLAGRVALVTGANHGIGAATARALAAQGAAVFVTFLRLPPVHPAIAHGARDADAPGKALYDRMRAKSADAVVAAIRAAGGRAEALEADLADLATIPTLLDRAEAAFGPVEILVNNADHLHADTLIPPGRRVVSDGGYPSAAITAEGHDRHFAVNSRAVALLMAEFARRRAARHGARGANWGRIVNVSTDSADGFPGAASYGASKAALESYSRAAAREFGPYGITVNVVSPGPTQTGYIPPETEAALAERIPLGRVGRPEDVADAILLLASEQARWITGQLLRVGGGHRM